MFYLYLEFPARWDCANFWTSSLTNSKACPRNYDITEIILPNVICVHCHILLAKFDNGDSVKLPTFFDFSSLQHSVLLNHAVVKSAKMLSLTLQAKLKKKTHKLSQEDRSYQKPKKHLHLQEHQRSSKDVLAFMEKATHINESLLTGQKIQRKH